MLIILKPGAEHSHITTLIDYLETRGATFERHDSGEYKLISVTDGAHFVDEKQVTAFQCTLRCIRLSSPAPLASGSETKQKKRVKVGDKLVGNGGLTIIAGPCSLENNEQITALVKSLISGRIDILRAGAFKPRTSPYSFQGLGEEGLKILSEISTEFNLPVVTEIMDTRDIDIINKHSDVLQVGMRNMRNYSLLKEVGSQEKPVLLKRGSDASVNEWLLAAEYIINAGNENVILCERGITNPTSCKNVVLDLNGALEIMSLSSLPVIVDPSHGAADRLKVPALARAAVAAGVDGVMIEVHSKPARAFSDGFQAIIPETFKSLTIELDKIHQIVRGTDGV